jgi:hypothetical protein
MSKLATINAHRKVGLFTLTKQAMGTALTVCKGWSEGVSTRAHVCIYIYIYVYISCPATSDRLVDVCIRAFCFCLILFVVVLWVVFT